MSGWTYVDDAWQRRAGVEAGSPAAAPPPSTDHAFGLGSVVAGRYVLKSYLGKGRYGEVYMAVDRSLSDPALEQEHSVALHLLRPQVSQEALQKLETTYHNPHLWSHPNVVKVRGFGADHGRYFLVTELLAGVSLRSVLDESPDELLSESEAFAVLRGVGDALKYAHAKGAIHGDIRPEKVFITEDYAVKVLDLLPTIPARTVPFFVEDAASGELAVADQRDDVYGLACIAYELLSGRHPFNGNSPFEALNAGLMLAPIPGMSTARWNALTRGLALRREHRTASVAALLGELGVTGDENLRRGARSPGAATGAAEPRAAAHAPPDRSDSADDVPIIRDPAARQKAAEPAPGAPAAPPPLPMRPAATAAVRQRAEPFDVFAERAGRRPDARPGRARGLLLAAVGAGIAVLGVVAYSSRDELSAAGESALAGARSVVANASRSSAERSAAPREAPAEGEEAVAAPEVAIVTPEPAEVAVAPPVETHVPTGDHPTPREAVAAPPATLEVAEPEVAGAPVPLVRESAAPPATTTTGPELVEFVARSITVSEAESAVAVTIRRSGGSLAESSVAWWTSEGSARADDDYANLGARIETFAAGETQRTIYVPLVRDSLVEGRETFYVNLRDSERAGARDGAQRIEIVIVDDD